MQPLQAPSLQIAYLYPLSMNIYGDRGNVITLMQRCLWREIQATVHEIEVGDKFDQSKYDILFTGGGQDRHQLRVADDLIDKSEALHQFVSQGKVALTVCGTYQLFGHYFRTATGKKIPGISIFDAYTEATNFRKIGNVVVELSTPCSLVPSTLVGFENHSGDTFLKTGDSHTHTPQTNPIAKVVTGFGNNGQDGSEGARYKNCFGTYLHGSLLPKNPHFADYLIQLALENKYKEKIKIVSLDDALELQAHEFIFKKRQQS